VKNLIPKNYKEGPELTDGDEGECGNENASEVVRAQSASSPKPVIPTPIHETPRPEHMRLTSAPISSGINIVKKRTVTETAGGGTIEQTAWQTLANTLVQCEFKAVYPGHSGLPQVTGAMGIFLGTKVERVRFILTPQNISEVGARTYDQIGINYLGFEGRFLGTDNVGFDNRLAVTPTFGEWEGWKFEFAEATYGLAVYRARLRGK
jgi:hypothetical protein